MKAFLFFPGFVMALAGALSTISAATPTLLVAEPSLGIQVLP